MLFLKRPLQRLLVSQGGTSMIWEALTGATQCFRAAIATRGSEVRSPAAPRNVSVFG
jgi:hypothetical protein